MNGIDDMRFSLWLVMLYGLIMIGASFSDIISRDTVFIVFSIFVACYVTISVIVSTLKQPTKKKAKRKKRR